MTTGKSYELSYSQKTLYRRTFFLTLHRNILISILIIIDIFCFLMYKKGWTYKVHCIWHRSQMLCIYSLIYTLYMAMIKGISITQHVTSSWAKSSINQIATGWSFNPFVLLSPGSLQEVSVVILLVLNTEVQQTR